MNKNYFNQSIWLPKIKLAGLPQSRVYGMHGLRHFCVAMWIEHGVNIKAVSNYLGHSDPGFTLRTYTHLLPNSESNARESFNFLVS